MKRMNVLLPALLIIASTNTFAEYEYSCCESQSSYQMIHPEPYAYQKKHAYKGENKISSDVLTPVAMPCSTCYQAPIMACQEEIRSSCNNSNDYAMLPTQCSEGDLWVPGYEDACGNWVPGRWRY